jgi:hypothetical protein
MKTSTFRTQNLFVSIILLVILFISSQTTNAQVLTQSESSLDYLFPKKKSTMIMLGTGIPYVGIAEISYGISNRFSIGIMAGTTPIVPGYGIRVKSILFQKNQNFRIFFKAPILYYPKTKGLGGEPWFLTRPSLNAEWKFDSGIRVSAGIGLVAAACANDLLGLEHPHEEMKLDSHADHDHHHEMMPSSMVKDDEGFMGATWNTIQTGIAIPLSKKMMFQSEFSLVLDGISIADDAWIGKVPVILFLGVSYSF